jgi:hypothetical protein
VLKGAQHPTPLNTLPWRAGGHDDNPVEVLLAKEVAQGAAVRATSDGAGIDLDAARSPVSSSQSRSRENHARAENLNVQGFPNVSYLASIPATSSSASLAVCTSSAKSEMYERVPSSIASTA